MKNSERLYIDKCKSLIQERLHWQSDQSLTQRDFEYLKDLIFDKTGTLLSISTLKRLWKSGEGLPHPGTLNALANYMDYKDWHEFKRETVAKKSFRK